MGRCYGNPGIRLKPDTPPNPGIRLKPDTPPNPAGKAS